MASFSVDKVQGVQVDVQLLVTCIYPEPPCDETQRQQREKFLRFLNDIAGRLEKQVTDGLQRHVDKALEAKARQTGGTEWRHIHDPR